MNKNDIKLILTLLLIILIFFLFKTIDNKRERVAKVYYNDELIETIPLTEEGIYTVNGHNGEVVMEVKNNKIKVIEEISEKNLCSKQGYGNIIICLPNKIIIKVDNTEEELDGVVK